MDEVCFGQDYKDKFDPRCYVSCYYSKDSCLMKDGAPLQFLHKLFSTMEIKPGGKLLEFGTGPCIHTVLSASRVFQDITLAEYAEQNREALQKWIKDDKDAYNWTVITSFVSELEGKSCSEIEMRTRNAIKEVIVCDVNEEDLQINNARVPYDFIITSLCFAASCKTVEHYKKCLKILCSYIKPGGGFILIELLGMHTTYIVGNYQFFNLPLTKEDLTHLVTDASMKIQRCESVLVDDIPGYPELEFLSVFATREA